MKKHFYILLLAALLVPWAVNAQVTCENGSPTTATNIENATTTTTYFPGYSFYNYSFSEVIVPAENLEELGDIQALMFKPTVTTAGSYFENCEIWLGLTNLETLSSGFIQDETFRLVYTGSLSYTSTDWQTIYFDSVFTYDGSSNLVVAVNRGHGSYSSGATFSAYNAGAQVGRYVYTDNSEYVFGSVTGGTASATVAKYQFIGCSAPIACARLRNLAVSDLTANSFVLSWLDTVNSATYTILNAADSSVLVSGITDTFYLLEDLEPNTDYTLAVYADCGGDMSRYSFITVHTPCDAFGTVPQVFDFESDTTGGATSTIFANCLTRLNNGSQYFGWPYVGASTYNHTPGGQRGLYWYNTTTTGTYGDYQYVVLPGVNTDDLELNTLQLEFWAKATTSSYNPIFEVGVMTNPQDPESFELVKTVTVGNSAEWRLFAADFSQYMGEGTYIAIRALRATDTWYAAIDDISVVTIPACPTVTNVVVNRTSAGSAYITWELLAGSASSYNYEYCVVGESAVTTGTTTEPNAILTGLSASTQYLFRVQANCDGDGLGEMDSVFLSTISMPCVEFDTSQIVTDTIGNGTTTNSYIPSTSFYNYGYSQQIFTASEMGGGAALMGLSIMPTAVSMQRTYEIYLGHVNVETAGNFLNPSDLTLVYEGAPVTLTANQWAHFDFDTPFAYNGSDNLLVVFRDLTGTYVSGTTWKGHTAPAGSGASRYVYRDASAYTVGDVTGGTASNFRNNIIFDKGACAFTSSCAAPLVFLGEVYSTSVTLTWAPGFDETSWNVEYRMASDSVWISSAYGVTATEYTIDNLLPATDYVFRVVNSCADGDLASMVSATTPCLPESLPFTEDFEDYGAGSTVNLGPCWYKNTTYSSYPYPYTSSSYAHSGNISMYFYGTSSYTTWLVLPLMTGSVHDLEVSFWEYKTSASYGEVEIGVMSDPTNMATFVPVTSVTPALTGTWEQFTVNFQNYNGPEGRIALVDRTASGNSYYIDDIEVNRYSACARPQDLSALHVTQNGAQLSWLAPDTAEHSYVVKWSTSPNYAMAVDSAVVDDATVYDITGLLSDSLYYAWVYTICGEDFGNPVRISFTTTSACGSVQNLSVSDVTVNSATISWENPVLGDTPTGYTVAVSSGNNIVVNTTTTNTYYFLTNLDTATNYQVSVTTACGDYTANVVNASFSTVLPGTIGGNEDDGPIPTYPYYNYSISEQIWTASELSGYAIAIDSIGFNSNGTNSNRHMQIWVGNTSLNDLTTSSYVSSESMTLVFDSTVNITMGWNWFPFNNTFIRDANQNFVVLTTDITGSYTDFTGWANGLSPVNTLYSYNDDNPYSTTDLSELEVTPVRVQMMLGADLQTIVCPAPSMAIAGVTENSIDIAWNGSADSYTVEYRLISDTVWQTAATGLTNVSTYTVTGLLASSQYYIRLTGNCGSNSNAAQVMGVTGCGDVDLPYSENFNDYGGSYFARPCWTVGTTNSVISDVTYPYVSNLIGQGPSLRLYQGAYVAMPHMNAPLNTLQVRFEYIASNVNIPMLFGYMTDPENIHTFTVLDTLTTLDPDEDLRNYTIQLNMLDDDVDGYIAFYTPMPPTNWTFIDNLVVEVIPSCSIPSDLSVDNITTTTAEVTWQSGTGITPTAFNVLYRKYGASVFDTITTNNNSATLTGLDHSTTYEVAVYAICSATDESPLCPVVRFITECASMSLPYTENFDSYPVPASYETGVMPNCWTIVSAPNSESSRPQIYYSSTYAGSGAYSLRLYNTSVVALPQMETAVDALQITFRDYVTSDNYALVVGVIDSLAPNATFHPADTIIVSESGAANYTIYMASAGVNTGYIAFKNININSGNTSYHYIDNVVVSQAPSCLPVTHVSAILDSASSITLDWTDPLPATAWEISYSTTVLTDPSLGTVIPVTTHPFVVDNLSDANSYYFYIRTVCGVGDSSEWTAVGPYRCHVVNMRANQTDTLYMCGGTIYDDGGPNGNYSASQQSYIILMPSDGSSLVEVNGMAYVEGSSWDNLYIYDGIGTTGTALVELTGSSYSSGVAVSARSNSGPLTIYFKSDGSVQYSGFELNVSCYFDNCPVTNFRRDGNRPEYSTSIALLWDGTSTSYELEYGPDGFAHGSGTVISTTTNSYTVTDLTPSTTYNFYVRGFCNDGDTGMWHELTYLTPMCDNIMNAENWNDTMPATTSSYSPIGYSLYDYGYVQTIIDSADLAEAGLTDEITAFAFNAGSITTGSTQYENMTVYLANVPENDMTSGWILPDSTHTFVKVIDSANFNFTTPGWKTHLFDSAFVWDGHSNIVVSVKRDHGDYSGTQTFIAHTHSVAKARYAYRDNTPYDYLNPGVEGTAITTVGDIRLIACGLSCPAPVNLTADTSSYNSLTFNWNDGDSAEAVLMAGYWDDNAIATATSVVTTTRTATFTGLQPNEMYTVGVRTLCEETTSDWVVMTVHTADLPCEAPATVTVTATTFDGATVAWTAGTNAISWEVRVYNNTYDETYTTDQTTYTFTGLNEGTFNVSVRSICSAEISSEWGEPIQFTTESCVAPTNVAVSNITATSAVVSWTAAASSNGNYTMEYGFSGFSRGQGTTVEVTGTTYTITGLDADVEYDVYVASYCGENIVSPWTPVQSFTTQADGGTYTITVRSNNEAWGTVTGGGTYPAGTQVTLTATPTSDAYRFDHWQDGNNEATRTITVTADATYTATFVENIGIEDVDGNAIMLYPNPASSNVTISGMEMQSQVMIVDMNGREVYRATATDGSVKIDVSGMSKGAYFVRITGEKTNAIRKLVVK